MTVGIAATCQFKNKPAIVGICDWQGTYGSILKAEDTYKIREAGNARILIAGDPSAADEFVSLVSPLFEKQDELEKPEKEFDSRMNVLLSHLRKAVQQQIRNRVDHLLAKKYNTNADLFRTEGSKNFPLGIYTNILGEVSSLGLGAAMIVAYNEDHEPILIRIEDNGDVNWVDNYTAIGSGSWVALAILCQDAHPEDISLIDCAAKIYFAKKAAEKNPAVGEYSSFFILTKEGEKEFTDEGWDFLKSQLKPIRASQGLEFKDSYLKSLED